MRKDSLIILVTTIVLTLGIVGGAHYLYLQNQNLIPDEPAVKPQAVADAVQPGPHTNQPARRRSAKIIQCTQPNGSVFWTNASHCKAANLNNTLSYYEHATPAPRAKAVNKRKTSSKQTSRQAKNSLKPIPRNMPISCKFPIGMARKIETRSLSLKPDPSESIWKNSYCRWVCEARSEGCEGVDGYLNLGYLCPERAFVNNVLCMD